jgi:putative ABC transport system substrate-binding protein
MLAGCAVLAAPVRARAGDAPIPVLGFLSGRAPDEAVDVLAAFHRGLAETGFTAGKNLTIEYRWAEGRYDRLPQLASDLVNHQVAVIAATGGSVSGLAAKAATTTIPIVFASGGDAVKLGLVSSLNRPGANVTGVNLTFGDLGPKRLELLHELIPGATSVAMLVNLEYPSAAAEVAQVQDGARHLGLQVEVFNAPSESQLGPTFATLIARKPAGLLVGDDPFLESQRGRLVELAADHKIPAIYFSRDFVDAGGLMSYGPSITNAYRLVGVYAGRILKGETPADLPVQQPTTYELVINNKTVRALNLAVPTSLLARANEVIE